VCAFQWVASNQAVLEAQPAIPEQRWTTVRYEGLVESPRETAAMLLDRLGLPPGDAVLNFAGELDRHVTRMAVTAPDPDKWRREHPAEVESILPMITPMMERLGYPLD
jgi:hypothetical protein